MSRHHALSVISLLLAFGPAMSVAQESGERFRSLDQDVQELKNEMLDLNSDLIELEEELLYPANSQTAFFVALDVGDYFTLDSVNLKINGKDVASYLYKAREVDALQRGGVHRLHMANLKDGDYELTAAIIGKGANARDYRRDATLTFSKDSSAKYVTLEITDRRSNQQPEVVLRQWE